MSLCLLKKSASPEKKLFSVFRNFFLITTHGKSKQELTAERGFLEAVPIIKKRAREQLQQSSPAS